MKTAIVPAEITSKEDTIAASLTLTQIILLVLPVFISAFIFAAVPPTMHFKIYKLAIVFFASLPFLMLAIRVKGQLVLRWIELIASFKLRPRIYLLSIPDDRGCSCLLNEEETLDNLEPAMDITFESRLDDLAPVELIEIESVLEGRRVSYLTDQEGRLNAYIKVG